MKRYPHLFSAVVVLVILVGGVIGGTWVARRYEDRYVSSLATVIPEQAMVASALQIAALHQPELLPLYGSSELTKNLSSYQAVTFFANYPTGFQVFTVSRLGITPLEQAQNIAALGPELKNKKIVISFTPSMFNTKVVGQTQYAGNFSLMHANELVFSPYLSLGLKRRAAVRMVYYPGTLAKDPLTWFALQNLAANTFWNDALYALCMPLGQLQVTVFRLQDHWETVRYIRDPATPNADPERKPAVIDWEREIARANQEQYEVAGNNPYGLFNDNWTNRKKDKFEPNEPGSLDQQFTGYMRTSKTWDDFLILLDALNELGAKPLVLGRPMNQKLLYDLGISVEGQQVYYTRIQEVVDSRKMPLVTFEDQSLNVLFSTDQSSHTSRAGWAYVDRVLDDFYHDRIPQFEGSN